jgi:hypothetical protein
VSPTHKSFENIVFSREKKLEAIVYEDELCRKQTLQKKKKRAKDKNSKKRKNFNI